MNGILKTKKWLSAVLACALLASMFTVSGCSLFGDAESTENGTEIESRKGASRAALEVMEAIDAIGNVTLQSEEAIVNAEALYAALSDSDKEDISNYDVLTAARSALDELKMQGFAANYLKAVKAAFLQPEAITLNHVYVLEAPDQAGSYYLTFDLNSVNAAGITEQHFYGNGTPVALNDEVLAALEQSASFSGLTGNNYWLDGCSSASQGKELNAEAIQADYAASF